ncbi:MAG: glycosyltransferase family 4 protein [Scytonema sp. PMC 1069.18]|nr:glycosyltransferase family 4 protein [Scytonema sp. PMC 1069.18]MEC4887069.1 glycosyltransferase family 4 protein [Scytonema sp. PMC 1070.18]
MFNQMSPLFLLCFNTFPASLLTVALVKQTLQRQLIDIPNERSSHTQPTPRGGGLGFIIAFFIATIACQLLPNGSSNLTQPSLWLLTLPLIAIGILDDWRGVPAGIRYLVQLCVSTVVVLQCGAFPIPMLSSYGAIGDGLATLITIIGMTALINFYNFMDGLDGLVAGVTAVQLVFLALWFHQPMLWLLVAALLGFLYWNWSPAKIFMGDAGSTVLGAVVAIAFLQSHRDPNSTSTALAILLPLIADAIYTLFRRLLRGENIFKAHRTHLYQRLQQSGWSHAQVASSYIGFTLLNMNAISLFGANGAWSSVAMTLIAIVLTETYLYTRTLQNQTSCLYFERSAISHQPSAKN